MPINNLTLQYSPLDTLAITSEKGQRLSPTSGQESPHEGMDFAAAEGTNLYNAHDGVVIYSGWINGYGNVLVIQDKESGQSTLYAHLSEKYFNKGDDISERKLIGKTGNSGTKAYHLHFEVLNKDKSDDLRDSGSLRSGGRLNPRTYIAVSPFASMLSTEVHSGKLGLGSREGDQRDNRMVRDEKGQMQQTADGGYEASPITFSGLDGDDTYEILVSYDGYTTVPVYDEEGNPVLNSKGKQKYEEVGPKKVYSQDAIDDVNQDGFLIIKNGYQTIPVTGSISPKVDELGLVRENVWTFEAFDFYRVSSADGSVSSDGDSLVIVKSASSLDSYDDFRLTIPNFPFSQDKAFGFSLGKTNDLTKNANGDYISTTGYDTSSVDIAGDSFVAGGTLVKTADNGHFFARVSEKLVAGSSDSVAVKVLFNSYGEEVSRENLHDKFTDVDRISTNPFYFYDDVFGRSVSVIPYSIIFSSEGSNDKYYSRVGFCVIDDSGKRIFSDIVAQGDRNLGSNQIQNVSGSQIAYGDEKYFYVTYTIYKDRRNTVMAQKIDRETLQKVDDPVVYDAGLHGGLVKSFLPDGELIFSDGNKIYVKSGTTSSSFLLSQPKYRDFAASEIKRNYNVDGGTHRTDPAIKSSAISLSSEADVELMVAPSSNSNTVIIRGNVDELQLGNSNPNIKINFPVTNPAQISFYFLSKKTLIQNMKNLLIALMLFLSSTFCAYAAGNISPETAAKNSSLTSATKSNLQSNSQSQTEPEDPDLKLSIEELKKKYPISLLDEKKKSYKAGQKINIDDYSIEEIKAAFLNADQNFVSRKVRLGEITKNSKGAFVAKEVENPKPNTGYVSMSDKLSVKSQQELLIIEEACRKIYQSNLLKLNKKWYKIFYSVFSDDSPLIKSYSYKYVSEEAQRCFGSVDKRGED